MDGFAQFSRSNLLFADDFDLADPAIDPEVIDPEVIEPAFSMAELAEVREAAWQAGRSAGLQEAAADSIAAVRETAMAIAAQLAAERATAAERAEQSATTIARLLLNSLGATLPAMCARHGDAEVRSLVRIVLPSLSQEPSIAVRAHPRTAAAVAEEIARLDPELSARVQTMTCDAMAPGDIRVSWRNGAATRDAEELCNQVLEVLAPIMETINGG